MTKKTLWLSLPLCMVIALLAAFLFVSPAFAQDEVPPEVVPTEAQAEVLPTEAAPVEVVPTEVPDEVLPTEVAPAEVLPTEAAPAEELPAEPTPVEEAPAAEPSLAEALDAANVVLADASGTPVTLAARSTGDLASGGDPYFKVGSTTYTFLNGDPLDATDLCSGIPNCQESLSPIQAALIYMRDHSLTPTDRKLYLLADTYNEYVDVDGSWNGVRGLLGIEGKLSPAEDIIINGQLYIHDFTSGFSVSNLTVNNTTDDNLAAIYTYNNHGTIKLTDVNAHATGEDSSGIIIDDIAAELNRVNSSKNGYHGLMIPWASGTVKITNSTFDDNLHNVNDGLPDYDTHCTDYDGSGNCTTWVQEPGYWGIDVNNWGSAASTTLFGVSASNNLGTGAILWSGFGRSISVKNSIFNDNVSEGLYIGYGVATTLENTLANGNGSNGIHIDAQMSSSVSGTYVTTDNNGGDGIYINTCSWGSSVCDNSSAGTVTLNYTGSSNNGNHGLEVTAKGAVTVNQGWFGNNSGDGINIDNTYSTLVPAVTLTGVETPWNSTGINLHVKGPVTLKDFRTHENESDGLYIKSTGTGAITITDSSNMFNETRNNGGNGYSIETLGPVTITNIDVHDNGMLGGYIDNYHATSAAAVTINMLGTPDYINGYWGNGAGGLQVHSRGAVTISRIQVNNNGRFGAEINNVPTGLIAGVPVTVSDSSFDSNAFGYDGLNITSKGQITLLNIRANYNGGYGVYLDNQVTGATAGVTINAGTGKGNEFQGNRLSGLVIRTNGAALLTNLYAANNGHNTYEALEDFWISTRLLFEPDSDYQFSGLVIYQDDNNFLQLGRAFCDNPEGCAGNGIYFDSIVDGTSDGINYATAIASLSEVYLKLERAGQTITGKYSLNGVDWYTLGSHTIPLDFQVNGVGLTASQDIYKSEPEKASDFDYFEFFTPFLPYVLNDFDGSLGDGWVWVNENSNYWNLDEAPGFLRILNSTTSTPYQNLLLKTVGMGYGVDIDAKGTVTINQVGGWGVRDNWADGNIFDNNATGGLKILSKGLVTLTNIRANGNSGAGAYLDNQVPGATGGVTINASSGKGNEFQWNTFDGLNIMTNGSVALTNIFAANNLHWNGVDPTTGGYGVYIDNFPGIAAITIKQVGSWCGNNYCTEGNEFKNNRDGGLWISTKGAVTVSFFQARDNWGTGIQIDAGGGSGAVTVSGLPNWGDNLANNGGHGIDVTAKGNITLSKVQASGNNEKGAFLDNCAYDSILDKCLGTGSVTLTDAYFDRNGQSGLVITSTGVVSWKNGSANNNGRYGAYLDNYAGIGKAVTVTNVNNASGNFKTGLYIVSRGVVTITDSQADTNSMNKHSIGNGEWWKDNLSDGQVWFYEGTNGVKATILVDSSRFTYRITVKDSNGDDVSLSSDVAGEWYFTPVDDNLTYEILVENADNWNGNGYEIRLYEGDTEPDWGAISPSEDPANGIFVDNSKGTNTGVTISNTNNRWNSNNSGTDVEVYSSGLITLKGMDLNDSGASGLKAVNSGATVGTPGVILTNVNFYVNDGGVVDSLVDKLMTAYIATKGPVTVKTSNLSSNFGYGYYVDNYTFGSAISPVTFTDVSVDGGWGQSLGFENPGITILSRGAVTFTNVRSDNNFGDGINIHTQGAVTFNGTWANNNWGEVASDKGYGAYVVTSLGTFTLNAPSSGSNGFGENDMDGLYVEAGGKITLNRIFANGNGWQDEYGVIQTEGNGISLTNTNALGTAPITLTEVTTNGNTRYGLDIYTLGAVTVSNLQSNDNIGFGLFVDQSDATDSLKPITLTKVTVKNNGMDGMYVDAWGSITTNTIVANNNQVTGVMLSNTNSYWNGVKTIYSTGTITMLNTLGQNLVAGNGYSFVDGTPNGGVGVNLESYGAVTVNQLQTIYNGGDGLVVDNTNTVVTVKPAVTLNSILSWYNEVDGIAATSSGVITINNSWVAANHKHGIEITTNANVFINNTSVIMNDHSGIWAANASGAPVLKMTGSTWFGNLRSADPVDRNLKLGTGWVLVVS